MSGHRVVLVAVALVSTACIPPMVVSDPHAVGPGYEQWEARAAALPMQVFRSALDVLADSGFTARNADPAAGIIATNLRSIKIGGQWSDYRLDLMLLPAGTDSTRIVIRCEWCRVSDGARQCMARDAYMDDWQIVRGIGEALLRRVSP